jgi:hypothetical protein
MDFAFHEGLPSSPPMTPREVMALLARVRVVRAEMQERLAWESHRTVNEIVRLENEARLVQSSESLRARLREVNLRNPVPPRRLGPISLQFEAYGRSLEQRQDERGSLERLREEPQALESARGERRTLWSLQAELQTFEQLPDVPSLSLSTAISRRLSTLHTWANIDYSYLQDEKKKIRLDIEATRYVLSII